MPRKSSLGFLMALLLLAAVSCSPTYENRAEEIYLRTDYSGLKTDEERMNLLDQRLSPLAEQGDRFAQFYLGGAYFSQQRHTEAAKWFRMGAQRGDPRSQYHFGKIIRDGLGGVPQDNVHAYKWFILAAEGANSERWTRSKSVPSWWPNRFFEKANERWRRRLLANAEGARDALAAEMSAAERAKGEGLARAWKIIP